ncbi:MAG: cytochrome c peroxidase [Bacteroidota bacterium]
MKRHYAILIFIVLAMTACQKEENSAAALDERLRMTLIANSPDLSEFILPDSDEYSKIPQDLNNPLTKAKVDLGRLLFHETGLAVVPQDEIGRGTYSCASCHFAAAGFQAGIAQGIGEGGEGFGLRGEERVQQAHYDVQKVDVQPIRTPTYMNIAYQELMLWNGQFGAVGANEGTEDLWPENTPIAKNHLGFEGAETQAIAALDVHRQQCQDSMMVAMGYDHLFDAAFPEIDISERYSNTTAGLAIAAYERTVLANQAPFQKWLRGDRNAMTLQEKSGAILFFGKAECATCHKGPALNEMAFHALGMKDLYESEFSTIRTSAIDRENFGRASFTRKDADKFRFKVPQLYNLADSPFYGHGSSFTSIEEVVLYKNRGKKENQSVPSGRLSEHFKPLFLDHAEVAAITAFLETGLYDPALSRYQPQQVLSNQCIPNNDLLSKEDLGCQ